jgi:hypothetical protein
MLIANLRLPAFRKPSLSAKQGLTSFVLLAILALNLFAGVALFSGLGGTEGQADARVTAGLAAAVRTKPAPEPLKFRRMSRRRTRSRSTRRAGRPGAQSRRQRFRLAAKNGIDANRAIDCLTSAIYYEQRPNPTMASAPWRRSC